MPRPRRAIGERAGDGGSDTEAAVHHLAATVRRWVAQQEQDDPQESDNRTAESEPKRSDYRGRHRRTDAAVELDSHESDSHESDTPAQGAPGPLVRPYLVLAEQQS